MSILKNDNFSNTIITNLERIIFEGVFGVKHNYAIFEFSSGYYCQILAARGDVRVDCEAVSNEFLIEDDFLDEEQQDKLQSLGWNPPKEGENYSLELPCDSHQARLEIADIFYATAKVFGEAKLTNVEVNIG